MRETTMYAAAATASDPFPVVGLIGAGAISRVHAPAWKALGARVLVYSERGAAELAARFDLEVVTTLDALLREVDFVDIVTPTTTHRDFALAAITAGRHVVCEKPLAMTPADSREIAAAAAKAGVQVYPAHVVRFTAPYATAHRAVADGRIGKVAVARFHRGGSSPAIGTWFQDDAASGGIIMDLMIHDLDQARWICGDVETVYAVQNPPTVDNVVPSFVSAHVTLTHAGGAISHVRATWGAVGTPFTTGFSIAGSVGVLNYSSSANSGLTLDLQQMTSDLVIPVSPLRESPYLTEIREFAAAFAGGAEPRISAADGVTAVELAQAARMSLATASVIVMSDFAASTEAAA